MGITVTGTVQANRKGVPKDVTAKKKEPRGTVGAARSGNMVALSWLDKRKVLMLSTKHSTTVVQVRTLDQNDKMGIQDECMYVYVQVCVCLCMCMKYTVCVCVCVHSVSLHDIIRIKKCCGQLKRNTEAKAANDSLTTTSTCLESTSSTR